MTAGVGPTAVPAPAANEFRVAGYNVERFFNPNSADDIDFNPVTGKTENSSAVDVTPAAYATRLAKLSPAVRHILGDPDIIGLEEPENESVIADMAAKISADAVAAGEEDPKSSALLLACAVIPAHADTVTYSVTVNTSSQAGNGGYIDLELNGGFVTAQEITATVNGFNGAVLNPSDPNHFFLGTSGPLPGPLSFDNQIGNDYFEALTFGNQLSFLVTLSGDGVSTSGASTSDSATIFQLAFLDPSQSNFLFSDDPNGVTAEIDVAAMERCRPQRAGYDGGGNSGACNVVSGRDGRCAGGSRSAAEAAVGLERRGAMDATANLSKVRSCTSR